MTRSVAATLLLLTALPASAFDIKDDGQLWTPVFINAPARGRLVGLLELQPRVRGDFGRASTLIVRPWLGWRVAPGTFLHAGYGWIRSDAARVTTEHRLWQQFQRTASPASGWTLTGRARLEQRMLESVPQTAWRARALLRAERVLDGGPRYAVAYNESFVSLNSPDGGPRAGFDQNRSFMGIGKDGASAKIEGGYQYVWVKRYGASNAHIHSIVINAFLWPFGRGG